MGSTDYYRFWASIEAETQDPAFPVRLCRDIRSEAFSAPLFAALCSPNLLCAAQRVSRFKALVGPLRLDIRETAQTIDLEVAWLDGEPAPPASLVITELLFCVTLARMGTRGPVHPLAVSTSAMPDAAGPYEQFLGVPVRRGPTHVVTFSRADATRPFLTSNDELWATFEPRLKQRLAQLDATATAADRVRAALLEGLPSGQITMGAIARRLSISKRTLQRRIGAEGTTYQAVLQRTRLELAEHYLADTSLPVAQVAFLLGFSEATSFYRAFRSWTGKTPETLRQELVSTL